MTAPISVLAVTADEEFAAACERELPARGPMQVAAATSVGEAIDVLESGPRIECVVSEYDLPDTNGVAFLQAVRAQAPTLPFVLFTGEGSEAVASRAISAGVTDYLIKDHHENQWDRLATLITDAVRYYRNQRDVVNTESRARALLDAANDVIGVVRDGEIAYLNGTGRSYVYGDDHDGTTGGAVSDVLVAADDTPITDLLDGVQSGARALDHRAGALVTATGTRVPVEITAIRTTWGGAPAVVLILRDVSERARTERDLRLANRAIDEAPVGITIADAAQPDNPIVYANEKFSAVTGYDVADALGRNCRFLQGEDTDPEPVAEMRAAIEAADPVTVELRNYRADGTEFWNRVTIAPITDGTGAVTHYVGFQEDVTARVEYQQMLRRFQRAVEAAGHAIYMTDPDGTITYVNPAFERLTGYDAEAAVGRTPRLLKSGEMSAQYYERLWDTITRGEVWEAEIRDRRKSGEVYYAHQTVAPLTDADGEVVAYVAIQQDVSEQKRREFKLRQYERAVEGADELIAAVGEDERYLFANEAYRDFHGLDAESLTETTLAEGIGSDTREAVAPHLKRAFAGETVEFRSTRTRPVRSDRTFDIRYYPIGDDDGNVEGVVATMRDLTDQIERKQHIAALDRMLRHTLHNELNVILGYAEMIREQSPEAVADLAVTIEDVADRILEQADKEREIVDLLSEPSDPTPLDLATVVESAVGEVAEAHPDAEITVEVPSDVHLHSIPELERAIEELVENAVVHTEDGTPRVRITAVAHETAVELRVADDGPGIPAEERGVISGDRDIDSLTHSSGMGLWLVKRILSRIDGDVWFEDADGEGSVVTLLLPR